jgi:hypothetical protein
MNDCQVAGSVVEDNIVAASQCSDILLRARLDFTTSCSCAAQRLDSMAAV